MLSLLLNNPLIIGSPLGAVGAGVLAMLAAVLLWRRRVAMPVSAALLLVAGVLALGMSAAGVSLQRDSTPDVVVMVDLSPSTRTAMYRDREALEQRIGQLLADVPHRILYFAAENHAQLSQPDAPRLPDLPAQRSVFAPPPAGAVLLFSDGRFELPPAAPPVWAAVDPLLLETADAAVLRLELREGPGRMSVAASVMNQAIEPRTLLLGGRAPQRFEVPQGSFVFVAPLQTDDVEASAQLLGSDPWPENDRLALRVPPAAMAERWWVGRNAPEDGWRQMMPDALPLDPSAYLAPAVVVLENLPARAITAAQQHRLRQYVRDLGGGLVVIGGESAYAAGGYPGTVLEQLLPLSSTPPAPAAHWVFLLDASGSMAVMDGPRSYWSRAVEAMTSALPHLPPADPVSIITFAADLHWQLRQRPAVAAAEASAAILTPLTPRGPTNLQPALLNLLAELDDAAMPVELLVLSDTDAELDADAVRRALTGRRIRLHVLAIEEAGAYADLVALSRQSGGQVMLEMRPAAWVDALRQALEQASPDHLQREAVRIAFADQLAGLGGRDVTPSNQTWLRGGAMVLGYVAEDRQRTMVARWALGQGSVIATAFAATSAETEAMAQLIAQPPRDPRIQITWDSGAELRVRVDAADEQRYLNDLPLALELASLRPGGMPTAPPQRHPIPQTAPGRYELALPAPDYPAVAGVYYAGRLLDRTTIAQRYAPEFEQIGTNVENLRDLTSRTGGAIVGPDETGPIEFSRPGRPFDLTGALAALGAALLAGGLVIWRSSRWAI